MNVYHQINWLHFQVFLRQTKSTFSIEAFPKKINKSTQFPDICIPDICKPIIDRPLFVSIAPRPPPNYYFQPPPKIIIIEYQPPVPTYFKTIKKKN